MTLSETERTPRVASTAVRFSVIVPCYNEEGAIAETLTHFVETLGPQGDFELIIVNDGSTDGTGAILNRYAAEHPGLRVMHHDRNRGYGAALKTGIRVASGEYIAITDADGTYPNERVRELVDACADYDMVVGACTGDNVDYSKVRAIPKAFLRVWASWIARQTIPDINSGMRVFRKDVAETYLGILPDTFSFTLTITLAMLTSYRPVLFIPISYRHRVGKSKIKPIRDTLRFVVLIMRTGMYFAPLRVFFPVGLALFLLSVLSLARDLFITQNLADTSVLLLVFTLNTLMMALLADMIDRRTR